VTMEETREALVRRVGCVNSVMAGFAGRSCFAADKRSPPVQPVKTTFRSQRPLHQVPLTLQPATNGDPIPSARDVHARANGRE